MERKYQITGWGYTVNIFDQLSKKKKFAKRYRLEYYQHVFGKHNFKQRYKSALNGLLSWASEIRYLIKYQIIKPAAPLSNECTFLICLSNSNSFLKTIVPVCEMLLRNGENLVFLCPANHYHILQSKLKPEIASRLRMQQQIRVHNSRMIALMRVSIAAFASAFNVLWFMFQPVKRSFSSSFNFGKYALIHHYFDTYWKQSFSTSKKTVLAGDDKYLWEMQLYSCAQSTQSRSYVFQHGKLSDIYYPTPAIHFCCWGQLDLKRMISEFKASEGEVIDIGSPYFDDVYNNINHHSHTSKKERKYICFLAQPFFSISSDVPYYLEALQWFYGLAQNTRFKHPFILKLHPNDKIANYKNVPANITIVNDNIINVLEQSLIAITVDSTSMLEASVAKTPIVQVLPPGNTEFSDDSATGISLKTNSYDELERVVMHLYEDDDFYSETLNKSSHALNKYFSNLGHSIGHIQTLLLK